MSFSCLYSINLSIFQSSTFGFFLSSVQRRSLSHFSHIQRICYSDTALPMGVWSGLRKFRAAKRRTARTEGVGARVSQRGFRVDSAPSLSSAENHRTWRRAAPISLDVSSSVYWTSYHRGGSISLSSSRYYRLMSSAFMIRLDLMMCYQLFACMHLLLCPYGSRLVFQGKNWPESNISAAWTQKKKSFPACEYLLVSKWQRTLCF